MEILQVVDEIKRLLGWPVVDIHTEDETIVMNIHKAFRKYSSRKLTEKYIAVPFVGNSKIDITEFKAEVVSMVTPELRSKSGYSNINVNEFDYRTQVNYGSSRNTIQDLAFMKQRMGNLEYILDSFDWTYEEPYLYVDNVPAGSSELSVLILTKPNLEDVDDIWIDEYALALTKVVEGRIRSKFSGGPMEFENDGSQLVDEGNAELTELEELLKGRSPMNVARRS